MNTTPIIYIIDDDTDDQNLLIEAIKEIDISIECYTAMNGQEGLNKLVTNMIPYPSLIFLDLNMPRIDGHKFLTMIKKDPDFKSIPIVIYSTSSNKKDMEEMLQLGAVDYLVKQADYLLLKENLSRMILK
ncbi:MAG: response regulator [Flavitalea sp.]